VVGIVIGKASRLSGSMQSRSLRAEPHSRGQAWEQLLWMVGRNPKYSASCTLILLALHRLPIDSLWRNSTTGHNKEVHICR